MGTYTFTVITCPIQDEGDSVERIAKRHAARLKEKPGDPLSIHFLEAVAGGRCTNSSRKGAGLAFAATGNNTDLDRLVEDLLPFFDELWSAERILSFEHVVLMANPEQVLRTRIAEIVSPGHGARDCCTEPRWAGKRVRTYDAPWSWHQM